MKLVETMPRCWMILVLVMLLPSGRVDAAAQGAGRVTLARGLVTVSTPEGDIRPLKLGDTVHPGETIQTGAGSTVQMRFTDGGSVFVRPSSRFKIDAYRDTGDTAKDRSFFSLLKGGFRAITGLIGHTNRANYRVNTPVATIGIRGTDFMGRLCLGDCLDLVNQGVQPPPDGLYTGVNKGGIGITTNAGTTEAIAGQFSRVTGVNAIPLNLGSPPPILAKDPSYGEMESTDNGDSSDQGQTELEIPGNRPGEGEGKCAL